MKKFAAFSKKFICLFMSLCILFLTTACTVSEKRDDAQLAQMDECQNYIEEELGVEIVEDGNMVSYVYSQDDCKMTYDTENGNFYYTDEDGTYPLEITDISEDGVISWTIEKEDETLEGQVNTSEAPSAQVAIAIAGTSYLVYTFVYCMFKAAVVVTVAGTTCYLASAAADAIKRNSKKYNYFPAYKVGNNVYVATKIGLTKAKAVARIKSGKNVWAKNADYAWSACVAASPIGVAEWGWHGNRDTSSGYYPHYHAIKYYKSNGQYVHTGAHCWYL